MTPDDHIDNSKWQDFFDKHIRYFSNAMLKQALGDLIDEQNARPSQDKPQPFLDELGKVAQELSDFHKEYNKEPF